MRIAYIHAYEGITAPLLLAACLDAGVSLAQLTAGWQALQLPALPLTSQRHRQAAIIATCLTPGAEAALALLEPVAWQACLEHLPGSPVPLRVQQRLAHLLQHFMATATRLYEVSEAEVLRTQAHEAREVLSWGSALVIALEALGVDEVVAAALPLGHGVHSEQRLAIPHPLTAALCQQVPVRSGIEGEVMTSISGAALLTGVASRFGAPPEMTLLQTAYGALPEGTNARHLQMLLGEGAGPASSERIAVLEANIDDMNPEFYEAIFERLLNQGALDVTLTPIFMKKNRPANTLTVLAPIALSAKLAQIMLQETSTFGVRVYETWRHKLDRFHRPVATRYGVIPVKCGVLQGHIVQAAPEYDACKRAARAHGVPVRLVYTEAVRLAAEWLTDGIPLP